MSIKRVRMHIALPKCLAWVMEMLFVTVLFVAVFVFAGQAYASAQTSSLHAANTLWLTPANKPKAAHAPRTKKETDSPPDGHRNKGMHALALSSDIDVRVLGPILRATVTQRFRNDSQVWMEGEYRFPLPEKAGVDQLRIRIGERVIEGQVKEKKVAKKAYRQAKQQGKRASLLAFLDASTFSSQIANIG
ncbi:MAG: VIT domain-containing protein, partial [Oleiphilaceae bacterium]|nr:VIT domain-containing protein [Oleiphilaceae bacterium]